MGMEDSIDEEIMDYEDIIDRLDKCHDWYQFERYPPPANPEAVLQAWVSEVNPMLKHGWVIAINDNGAGAQPPASLEAMQVKWIINLEAPVTKIIVYQKYLLIKFGGRKDLV